MIREPWFWREQTIAAKAVGSALAPIGAAYNVGQKLRWRMTPTRSAPLPVLCVGNATLGGAGKTPFAIMLGEALAREGLDVHFLSRGYGGRLDGPARVAPDRHDCADVGDEALLLAEIAPTWIARERAAGAAAAADAGADLVVMDDGFQNNSLEKTLSFLLVDNDAPQLSAKVFPAGRLREPVVQALARADALVVVKRGLSIPTRKELTSIAGPRPVFSAALTPAQEKAPARAVAFCGLARPERFFAALERAGIDILRRAAFADHHAFTRAEMSRLRALAARNDASLITTAKDYVRLSEADREDVAVFRVRMETNDEPGLVALARRAVARWREAGGGGRDEP